VILICSLNYCGNWLGSVLRHNWQVTGPDRFAAEDLAMHQTMSAEQQARVAAWTDEIYQGFVTKVAACRNFDGGAEWVDAQLARGRVFHGAEALDNGLVDSVGGLEEALSIAAELAGRHFALRCFMDFRRSLASYCSCH